MDLGMSAAEHFRGGPTYRCSRRETDSWNAPSHSQGPAADQQMLCPLRSNIWEVLESWVIIIKM